VLGVASWRTAYKRLAIGRMLAAIGEAERPIVRAAIAAVGLAKASMPPAIEGVHRAPCGRSTAVATEIQYAAVAANIRAKSSNREHHKQPDKLSDIRRAARR